MVLLVVQRMYCDEEEDGKKKKRERKTKSHGSGQVKKSTIRHGRYDSHGGSEAS